MMILVRRELYGTRSFAISAKHIVSGCEVILKDDGKYVTGLQVTLADGTTHNIVEGLTFQDLEALDLITL